MKRENTSTWQLAVNQQRITIAGTVAISIHLIIIWGINFTIFPDIRPAPVLSLNVELVERISGELNAATNGVLMPVTPRQPEILMPGPPVAPPPSVQPEAIPLIPASATNAQQTTTVLTAKDSTSEIPMPQLSEVLLPNLTSSSMEQPALPYQNRTQRSPSEITTRSAADLNLTHLEVISHKTTLSPREKYIEVFDTGSLEGFYAENWRLKVEQIGTLNFPVEAREQNLVGKLTLDVAIRFDGTIQSINLLQSSGYEVLDKAAHRIVNLAGPFEPFPEMLRRRYDLLHIVRTWEFDQGDRLNSH
jgi:protein TonB